MASVKQSPVGRPKSLQKRTQILASAAELFLSCGFAPTSMDTVAKHSAVSKQTVYSHFANKDELFAAVIDQKCQEYQLSDINPPHLLALTNEGFRGHVEAVAIQFVALLQDPMVTAMYNVIISEAKSQPQLASVFYDAGPKRAVEQFQACLQGQYLRLANSEAHSLAIDFFNLLKGEYHMQSLLGIPFKMDRNEQVTFAQQACHKFFCLLPITH